ncbi:hypothetical protein [Cohnella hashimotonis]|uniref:Uncharacterized protein n=1 Tax=Cohnella hashimotonis TaxID=2826895 RepID=A0ABT6TBT7_9BACL|nr:hypothetical protein [Cohnella hashimotonis]MDI4644280.1 hypothetical protein [Cohnella hashimotonis]
MPKIQCTCGNMLRMGDIPCKIQYMFISDTDFDELQGAVDAEELYLKMKMFFQCDSCSRLWVYWNGFDNPPKEYAPAID